MPVPYNADPVHVRVIQAPLGDGWDCHAIGKTVMVRDDIYSMACEARYCHGHGLVVYVNVDRGAYSILVGTGRPDDMYPFEDVAVHCGWCEPGDLHGMINNDAVQPLMPLPEALHFLSDNAEYLDAEFAPESDHLRNGLRKVADQFHAAWNAIEKTRDIGRGR